MNQGNLLYPRLDPSTARGLLAELAGFDTRELHRSAALDHAAAAPSATGGHPAPAEKLREVQEAVREVATQAGYPRSLGARTQEFDRPCGTTLHRTMSIVPADAAEEGVWSFITLVLLPEIGPWRFPEQAEDRMLGRPRNVFRRLWWRAWALGPDLEWSPEGCRPLGEDEYVQIMERPTLGGNRRTARAMQDALWRAELAGTGVPRSEVMRQLARRLRATRSHIMLDVLRDDELSRLLDRLVAESVEFLRES